MTEPLTLPQRLRAIAAVSPDGVRMIMTPDQALVIARQIEVSEQIEEARSLQDASRKAAEELRQEIEVRTAAAHWRMEEVESQLLHRFRWWAVVLWLGWAWIALT